MIKEIIKTVSLEFGVAVEEITGKRGVAHVAESRQVVMYLGRQLTDLTLGEIGEELGGRTAATISWGYQRIAERKEVDRRYHYKLQVIEMMVQ